MNQSYIAAENIISALGFTTEEHIREIEQQHTGVVEHAPGFLSFTPKMLGMIDIIRLNSLVEKHHLEHYPKAEQLLILSITDTLSKQNIRADECAFVLATTKGNIESISHCDNQVPTEAFLDNTAKNVSQHFGFKEHWVVSNACISGVSALIIAHRFIKYGHYKHVVVSGVDLLSEFVVSGFDSFHSLSPKVCRPYDASRDGLNIGEACATVLLSQGSCEDAVYIAGGAMSNDANHISGPSRTGDGLALSIECAIRNAGISKREIDFINLHGTATVYNDEMESKAVNLAGLSTCPVNSLKPYLGHTLGASGVAETILTAHQLKNKRIFATAGFEELGVPCMLTVSNTHTDIQKGETALKTASGFGGCNAALILSRLEKEAKQITTPSYSTISSVVIERGEIYRNKELVLENKEAEFPLFIREAYKQTQESYPKFYKMDNMSKLAFIAANHLLKDISFAPEQMGVILANRSSSLDTDLTYQQALDKAESSDVSPAVFVYTLANIAIGEICIRHKIKGENIFFIADTFKSGQLHNLADMAMRESELNYCIIGWCDYLLNDYRAEFYLLKKEDTHERID